MVFAPCDSQQCVNISITNDLINEPEETFTISLTVSGETPSFITLTSANGEVVTHDDDGKHSLAFTCKHEGLYHSLMQSEWQSLVDPHEVNVQSPSNFCTALQFCDA